MVNIIKKELEIDEGIKSRIDFICKFTNTKATYLSKLKTTPTNYRKQLLGVLE